MLPFLVTVLFTIYIQGVLILKKNSGAKGLRKYRTMEVTGTRGRSISSYWMTLGKDTILAIERRSTRSHSVENWLWKRLLTCHGTDRRMNE
jgi:hypothetical protein